MKTLDQEGDFGHSVNALRFSLARWELLSNCRISSRSCRKIIFCFIAWVSLRVERNSQPQAKLNKKANETRAIQSPILLLGVCFFCHHVSCCVQLSERLRGEKVREKFNCGGWPVIRQRKIATIVKLAESRGFRTVNRRTYKDWLLQFDTRERKKGGK